MPTKINVKGPIVDNDIGWIYHYLEWDCCCPKDVEEGLKKAGGEPVVLEINSPGGYCDVASEIYTMLMGYEGDVEAHVMIAASAATVIACAADKVMASDTMVYMIHNSHGGGNGDYRDMANISEELQKYNESIINAYMRKTGKSREELQDMMDHTTWMSAQDAISHGFVDDYLFGNPDSSQKKEEDGKTENVQIVRAMNSMKLPVISHEKAAQLCSLIQMDGQMDKQNNSMHAVSDIATGESNDSEGGKNIMTLEEFLNENPEAKAEFDRKMEDSAKKGAMEENSRLKDLDAIAKSVSAKDLDDAKYGENRMDAKALAYQALINDGKNAANYMKNAVDDAKDSGVEDVGASSSDPQEPKDESDAMAAVANAKLKRR